MPILILISFNFLQINTDTDRRKRIHRCRYKKLSDTDTDTINEDQKQHNLGANIVIYSLITEFKTYFDHKKIDSSKNILMLFTDTDIDI